MIFGWRAGSDYLDQGPMDNLLYVHGNFVDGYFWILHLTVVLVWWPKDYGRSEVGSYDV